MTAAGEAESGAIFTALALEKVARTIAHNNGDARRALEFLRTHIERKILDFQQKKRSRERMVADLASSSTSTSTSSSTSSTSSSSAPAPKKMKFSNVNSTINETYGSTVISDIRSLSLEGQIILIVYAQQMDTSQIKKSNTKLTVSKLHEIYCNQSRKLQHDAGK